MHEGQPRAARDEPTVLAVNAGSSSIKFALHALRALPERIARGQVERVGSAAARLVVDGAQPDSRAVDAQTPAAAADVLMDWLIRQPGAHTLAAVGHRVVHGGPHYAGPQRITPEVVARIRELAPFDSEHLPAEIGLIEAFARRFPGLPQVACFDTAFHHDLPRVARLLPIPRRYEAAGVRRYGFHGLSYAFLVDELGRLGDPAAKSGRVILAHLGNGASLAAVRDGHSIDTSMAFTPSSGVPMGTRSGDLDPGLAGYLARTENMSAEQFSAMAGNASGLLGVSGISADMRDLLAQEDTDTRAADAVALFCYSVRKCIGAYAAALGGVDVLVFAGGIGEKAAPVRARICAELGFLGITLNDERNARHAALISPDDARVRVRVIPTDEERMIAIAVSRLLHLGAAREP